MIFKFLNEMDDLEFKQIPTLLFTYDTLIVLDCYANKINVIRKSESKDGHIGHTFYYIG